MANRTLGKTRLIPVVYHESEDTVKKLDRIAKKEEVSRAHVIRELIDEALEARDPSNNDE